MIERVSCFPNEGTPVVIPGEPADGDLVRVTNGSSVIYQRYTVDPGNSPPSKRWDAFDFKSRFTVAERKAIRLAAASNGDVEDFLDMLNTAGMTGTLIVADDKLLNGALDALTGAGILAAGRKAEILG